MKIKTIGIMALMLFAMSAMAAAIGNWSVEYPQGTELFKVNYLGDVIATTRNATFATLVATTWLDVQTDIDLPDNTVDEVDILFATSCGTGNHLYVSGGNLACEADQAGGNSTAEIQAVAVGGNLTGTVGAAKLVASSVGTTNILDETIASVDILNGGVARIDLAEVYRLESWDNFSGIPTATPSNGDTTHLSTADHIFDYIVTLSYLADVVDDTTPELGGNLDILTYNITSGGGTAMMIDATENFIIVLGG